MKDKFFKQLARIVDVLPVAMLALVLALSTIVYPAYALNNDQTRNFSSRSANQKITYWRLTINWNDPNISTGQQFGAMSANTYIVFIDAYVTTAFNAGTTNVITLGTTKASANELVASGITAGTPGVYHLTSAAGLGLAVSENGTWLGVLMPLFAKYAQTGTAATAGSVTIVIGFASNDDM
jgi:hypothetical protein